MSFRRRPRRTSAATAQSIEVDAEFLRECREGYEATSHSTAGLINAFARRCKGPGAEWFYFGATVQDIADTWLMITLREARGVLIADLERAMAATGGFVPAPSRHDHGRPNAWPAGPADHLRLQGRGLACRIAPPSPALR